MSLSNLNATISSFTMNGSTLEDAYSQLDAEISQVQERLCSLRTLRNSWAPISKVPMEVLSKIFLDASQHSGLPLEENADLQTRFYLSWVCRHWRNTALATPCLWTFIAQKDRSVPLHTDFVQEMIDRSGNSALSVDLFIPPIDVLRLCLMQMARIRHLRLLPPSVPEDFEYDEFMQNPASLLTFLDTGVCFPVKSVPGVYPRLRHLEITEPEEVLKASSPLFTPTLTILHIIRPLCRIPLGRLLAIFSSLPNLEELRLVGCLYGENLVVPAERISRPTLQIVSITDFSTSGIFAFLAHLSIPQAAITISWPKAMFTTNEQLMHFSTTFDLYRSQVPFDIRNMEMKCHHTGYQLDISSSLGQHRHTIRFPHKDFATVDIDTLLMAVQFEALETIETTTLTNDLVQTLEYLSHLRRIALHGNQTLQNFVERFMPETEGDAVFFSALEELSLHGIEDQEVLGRCYEALEIRQELGFGLARLVLEKSPCVDPVRFENVVDELAVID